MMRLLKPRTWEDRLLFAYGFFGTMPIIELFGFTLFTWLSLIISLYVLILKKGRLAVSRPAKMFTLISAVVIISSVLCMFSSLPGYWRTMARNNIIWQILYLIIILYYVNRKRIEKCNFYIKGIYYAAIAHSVWGVLQILAYRFFSISINKLLFFDLLRIESAEYVQTRGSSIAMTGFCWNAGNLAPLVIIGYVLSSSVYLKILFIAVTVLSGSRTLVLGMIAVMMLQVFIRVIRGFRKSVHKKTFIVISAAVVFGIAFVVSQRSILSSITERVQDLMKTFSGDFLRTQASSRIHARYWTSVPQVTGWNSLIHNLIGYGSGCSGYPFAALFNQFADHAWTVECDFIKNLWEMGYLGFILWYGWYASSIVKSFRIDKRYLFLFCGLLVEGVTYNVTFNWCYILVLILFGNIHFGNNIFGWESKPLKEIHCAII